MKENRLLTDEELARYEGQHWSEYYGCFMDSLDIQGLLKAQDSKTASIKEAEFKKKCKECEYDPQADMVGWFLEHGWIPPEEALSKMKPEILSDAEIGDLLDCGNECTYASGDGSWVTTVDIYPALKRQRDDTYRKTLEQVVVRLDLLLKHNPIRTVSLRRELGKYVQALNLLLEKE